MPQYQFKFSQPLLIRSAFNMIPPTDKTDKNITLHLRRNTIRIEGKNQAVSELTVQLNKEEETVKENAMFVAEFTMQTMVSWEEGDLTGPVKDFVEVKVPEILLSYIRPLVATITGMSPVGTYHIPYINMAEVFKGQSALPTTAITGASNGGFIN